ncbi:MAG TPA: hypothetical protein VL326_07695 [Kofleriaceae bacterium]|jgi:hypothetical protein|nr:hypothetical protein [Kofleriaceae bacterium]
MASDDNTDDKTVKQLIDEATKADLERWFGLPSFQQVDEEPDKFPVEDPDIAAVRERREKAIAAVDPAMVERHRRRFESPETLIQFKPNIELRVDPDVALLDTRMIDRGASIADPREVEIPDQLRDDLNECTPQAILRDLHRPETDFEKVFEVVDFNAENRIDVVGIVREMMSTKFNARAAHANVFREGREILLDLRAARRQSWTDVLPSLPNRRVQG